MMNKLAKAMLIGLVTAGIGAGGYAAYANDAGCRDRGMHHEQRAHGDWGPEAMAKRQAKLHAALKLTPEQETAWNTFAEKMKPAGPMARPDWSKLAKETAPERMENMLALMKAHQARMESHLQVVKDFYAQLTPDQQKVFDQEFMARHHRHHR